MRGVEREEAAIIQRLGSMFIFKVAMNFPKSFEFLCCNSSARCQRDLKGADNFGLVVAAINIKVEAPVVLFWPKAH